MSRSREGDASSMGNVALLVLKEVYYGFRHTTGLESINSKLRALRPLDE
jgi:hypothetical protein